MLSPGSSPIDWCEKNYNFTPFIAEFANTMSNIIYLALPPVLIHLFKNYNSTILSQNQNYYQNAHDKENNIKSYHSQSQGGIAENINIIWGLLIFIGLSSIYFHSTLSLFGQLLDELSILWCITMAFYFWFNPSKIFNYYYNNNFSSYKNSFFIKLFNINRSKFKVAIIIFSTIVSFVSLLTPSINAFALMLFGIPSILILIFELNRCTDKRIIRLGKRSGLIWLVAVCCWVNDKFYCDLWLNKFGVYWLHALWHILIFISAYTACVLFAYFDAKDKIPNKNPKLIYWPNNDNKYEVMNIPYIIFY